MPSHIMPHVASITLVGTVSVQAQAEQIHLSCSLPIDSLLLALGTLLFYSVLALWIRNDLKNRR